MEGLALRRPRPSAATIARRVAQVAGERGWPAPSYSTVASIVAAIDPALLTLAHDGAEAFRDRYELAFRRQAQRPNDVWQADHTQLDVLIVDANAEPARPWLTLVLDDHSRAVAGYSVFLGAPSALNLTDAPRCTARLSVPDTRTQTTNSPQSRAALDAVFERRLLCGWGQQPKVGAFSRSRRGT